jgi:hypothetical protein
VGPSSDENRLFQQVPSSYLNISHTSVGEDQVIANAQNVVIPALVVHLMPPKIYPTKPSAAHRSFEI